MGVLEKYRSIPGSGILVFLKNYLKTLCLRLQSQQHILSESFGSWQVISSWNQIREPQSWKWKSLEVTECNLLFCLGISSMTFLAPGIGEFCISSPTVGFHRPACSLTLVSQFWLAEMQLLHWAEICPGESLTHWQQWVGPCRWLDLFFVTLKTAFMFLPRLPSLTKHNTFISFSSSSSGGF